MLQLLHLFQMEVAWYTLCMTGYQPIVRLNSMQFAESSVISSMTYTTESASCKAACIEQEQNAEEPTFAAMFTFTQDLHIFYQVYTSVDGTGLT